MSDRAGPSTAPREWELSRANVFATTLDGPQLELGEKVAVVERASLDRVVEERDELREALNESGLRYNGAEQRYEECAAALRECIEVAGATVPDARWKYPKAAVEAIRAALQSGEGGTA